MKRIYNNFIFSALAIALAVISAAGQNTSAKSTLTLALGETPVKINVYEKNGARVTFLAPHYDEQIGARLVKESIGKAGGRLVEIESVDAAGKPSRYVAFSFKGKNYRLDPNRIFTSNGRRCAGFSGETEVVVKAFADAFLNLVLDSEGALRNGELFLAAVHNNMDVGAKKAGAKNGDLTAYAFVKHDKSAHPSRGAFQQQAEGVYLSNLEEDEDNFIFLSAPAHIGFFASRGFNVVVQKPAAKLQSTDCAVDDGSLSVFAARQNLSYINVEADAGSGAARQRQMIESIYELAQTSVKFDAANPLAKITK